jgi:VCBS repeat-containing protein
VPTAGYHGADSFTYRANDGAAASAPAVVTIEVNGRPTTVPDSYYVQRDSVLSVPAPGVLSNDSDPEDDPIMAVLDSGPDHGEVTLDNDGSFTYTPDLGFTGTDSFWYAAYDNMQGGNNAEVTIEVTEEEPPPDLPDGCFRVAGTNRYLTSVAASKRGFPDGAKTVVVATGANWPDALGGSALAGAADGPLLLTRTDALPSEVWAEIDRLDASKAYILGSTAAVSSAVETYLKGKGLTVTRLGGANRYETARKVADETIRLLGDDYSGHAFVATGLNFPDATGAAPLAAALGRPILLANVTAGTVYVPAKTTEVVILGSAAAVPSSVEAYLDAKLGADDVDRLAGKNRYDTAAMAAQLGVNAGMRWDGTGLATGLNFPDALSGGAMLGKLGSVMLLTRPDTLSGEAYAKLYANRAVIDTLFIFGDTNAVSGAVETAAKKAATVE